MTWAVRIVVIAKCNCNFITLTNIVAAGHVNVYKDRMELIGVDVMMNLCLPALPVGQQPQLRKQLDSGPWLISEQLHRDATVAT
jgi:hypothetical protein